FASRRRHTRSKRDWSSDVCSSALEFLNQTFTKSEENAKLYQAVMDSPSVIGLGVDQQTQKETAGKAQQASEEFEKAYSTYLDSRSEERRVVKEGGDGGGASDREQE